MEDWYAQEEAWLAQERASRIPYYFDPEVVWLEAGFGVNGGILGGPITDSGFYLLFSCRSPDCCRPAGPFKSVEEAKAWSKENWPSHDQAP
jgi:hypothetical protein